MKIEIDTQYFDKFNLAKKNSSNFNITHRCLSIEEKPIDKETIFKVQNFGIDVMKKGLKLLNTSQARNLCIPVHYNIHAELLKIGFETEVTIGNAIVGKNTFIKNMSASTLENELKKPDVSKVLDAHVWLTLKDGSIFDFTINSNYTNPNLPEPIEKNIIFINPNEHDENHYYEPIFVGSEYLFKVKAL